MDLSFGLSEVKTQDKLHRDDVREKDKILANCLPANGKIGTCMPGVIL